MEERYYSMYGDANAVSNPVQRRKTSDSGDRRGNSPSNKLKQGILLFREIDLSMLFFSPSYTCIPKNCYICIFLRKNIFNGAIIEPLKSKWLKLSLLPPLISAFFPSKILNILVALKFS